MSITNISGTHPAQFTLDGTYEWKANIPEGVDTEAYLTSRVGSYRLRTKRMEYPDAPNRCGMTLEEFTAWIAAGCIIPATETEDERVAEKVAR